MIKSLFNYHSGTKYDSYDFLRDKLIIGGTNSAIWMNRRENGFFVSNIIEGKSGSETICSQHIIIG